MSGTKVHPKVARWLQAQQPTFHHTWRLHLSAEARRGVVQTVRQNSEPAPSYFILIVLSTLIAAFGLVANSTATVIGAMIVAPLMGPILGLAMAMVRGNRKMFNSALFAELLGVVLVVLTGILVALLVGPENIEFASSEIVGRTSPTLYDLLIGLAAGLAGAYCTSNPRLSASVAGVAIAVALVPPLTVTGLCVAGAVTGNAYWSAAFGSFMLFLANFLTIELASMAVFTWAGLGDAGAFTGEGRMRRPFVVVLGLLAMTTLFLGVQLNELLVIRRQRAEARTVLQSELLKIPGATLSDLRLTRRRSRVAMEVTVGSRQEINPDFVRELENLVTQNLGTEVDLTVRAVASTYVTGTGFLYEPPEAPPDPKLKFLAEFEQALNQALAGFPGAQLQSFREIGQKSDRLRFEIAVRSPYVFEPTLVGRLEQQLSQALAPRKIEVVVQTLLTQTATYEGYVQHSAPETRSAEELAHQKKREAIHDRARQLLTQRLSELAVAVTAPIKIEDQVEGDERLLRLAVRVEGSEVIGLPHLARWEKELEMTLRDELQTSLNVLLTLHQTPAVSLEYQGSPDELRSAGAQLLAETKLKALVGAVPGAELAETSMVPAGPGAPLKVRARVLSPKLLEAKQMAGWEKSLEKVAGHPIHLVVQNQVGKVHELGGRASAWRP